MLLKSLKLRNVRTYEDEILNFTSGINFLSGDIGCGKSTILMSIEFLFFGIINSYVDGKTLLRKGKKDLEIVGKFFYEKENIQIEIKRKIKKQKNNFIQENGTLKVNNEIFELTPTELNYKIYDIFGFEKSHLKKDKNLIFRYSTYTAQEELKKILYQSDKKLEIIRKIFKITKYTNMKNASEIYQKSLRDDLKSFEIKNEEKKNYMSKIDFNEEKFNEVKINFDMSKKKLEDITKKINDKNNSVKNLEKDFLEKKEVENKIKNKKERLEIIEKILLEKNLKQDFLKQKNDLEKNLLEYASKLNSLEKNINKLNEDKKNLQKDFNKLNEDKIFYDKTITQINFYNSQIKNDLENRSINLKKISKENKINYEDTNEKLLEIEKIKKQIKEIDEKILILNTNKKFSKDKIKDILENDICPTCLQKIDSNHKKTLEENSKEEEENFKKNFDKYNLEKEFLEKKILEEKKLEEYKKNILEKNIKVKTEVQKLKEDILDNKKFKELKEELENKIKHIDLEKVKENYINNISLKIKEYEKNIDNSNKEFYDIKEKKYEVKNKLENFEKEKKDLENLEKEKKEINDFIENFLKDFEENNLKILEEKLIKLKKELENFLEEEKIIIKENEKIKYEIDYFSKQINIIKSLENEIKEFDKKIIINKKYYNFLEKLRIEILPLIEGMVLKQYHLEFNESFSDIFRELIEDYNVEVFLDEEFEPKIVQNGYEINIENLSGGEKSSVALSYKLSLKNIIRKSNQSILNNFLILDEPTDGFSKYQIDKFSKILKNLELSQIIIVSHDTSLKYICDNLIEIQKENHLSKVIN